MKTFFNKVLIQMKFFLVAFLNLSKEFFPYPLRNLWLLLFGIKVSPSSSIHRHCRFFHIGKMQVGKNSTVNFGCFLDNRRGITIGSNTAIAHNTKIYTLGHNIDSSKFETKGDPVKIGDNVFVFSNVMIMPGVTVENGAVILPGTIVTKNVPEWTVVGGNPAKEIRKRDPNINYKTSYNYWFAL